MEEEINPLPACQHLCNLSAFVPLQDQHLLNADIVSIFILNAGSVACGSCSISLSFHLHSAIQFLWAHPLALHSEYSLCGVITSRGRDLKKQHEQRVYERKMQRINLPLSAFSNPSCELVDEHTVVITAVHEMTPVQKDMDGGDPLIGQQAGTPGAWVQSVLKKKQTKTLWTEISPSLFVPLCLPQHPLFLKGERVHSKDFNSILCPVAQKKRNCRRQDNSY